MIRNYKKQKRKKGLLIICLLLIGAGMVALGYLNETRKELKEKCEEELLLEVKQGARETSSCIREKFAALETIQELIGKNYEPGMEAAKFLEASRERYGMEYLGVVDRDYVYYGSTGQALENTYSERIDRAFSGEYVVARSLDKRAEDGVVFFVPYWLESEIAGVLCSEYTRTDLLEELYDKSQDGANLVVDADNQVVLASDDYSEYIGGKSWEEFSRNGAAWLQKEQFDEKIKQDGFAVASVKTRFGNEVYFAAAKVDSYENFYVIRIADSEVVEKEIHSSMLRVYFLMWSMVVLMACVLAYAIIVYSKNRKEIYKAAYIDQLTGIPSKTKHKLDAQEKIDKQDRKYAYVTFDVDNFKYINEVFGYEYGNRILIHIAMVLKTFVKENELYARISGDNFAMLLVDEGTKEELSKRIGALFETIIEYREPEEDLNLCALKFSCGVYQIEGAKDINKVRANANLARTESKRRVLDEIVYYDEKLKTRRVEERELEYEAEEALSNGEFLVYFQPKYDVESEKIIGAEALVRWKHPERGMLSPALFIPVFETNGFIIELDMYVLDKVCELIETWMEAGIAPICISVNLSRTHLYERNLVERLVSVVKRHNVLPEYIEFELTESAFYEEMESLLQVMTAIKKEGFRLSMDDFGSGYSSLNLLRRLPVDVLKLDKGFLEECDEREDNVRGKRIVMHVISMAKDLEMEVLAEGVETEGQKEFLQEARCDMIQGYYYAKPMPMDEFEELYKKQGGL